MELKIINTKNSVSGKVKAPKQFNEEIRPDLISRAVLAVQSHKRQPYGAHPEAGKRASAELSRRRRKYRGSYGIGISRVPRKILSRRGTRMNWVGAFAPGTVGGRRAHPPKAEKNWSQKINDHERKKAIRSAMAATLCKEIVEARGHLVPENYPFTIDDDFEKLGKTKDVKTALLKLGFDKELNRAEKKTIKAGRGKSRGRKYRKKKSVLLVVAEKCSLIKAAKNLPGVDIVTVESLNAELLAPGTDIGRATLFTKKAMERLEKEQLFTKKSRLPKEKKAKVSKKKAKAEKKKVAEKAEKKAEPKKVEKKPEVKKEVAEPKREKPKKEAKKPAVKKAAPKKTK